MSDAPNRDDIIAIANEYRRLQIQLESKEQQLQSLLAVNAQAGDFPTDFVGIQNRRYSIEFPFDAGDLNPQERSVTVQSGTIFRCAYVESFVRAVGSAGDPYSTDDVAAQLTLPWDVRVELFDFLWRIRDTGTDREWCDQLQPSLFLGGGYFGPLWLPRRTILSGGTTIFANLAPFLNNVAPTVFFQTGGAAGAVQQYITQVSFVGYEEPDGSAL